MTKPGGIVDIAELVELHLERGARHDPALGALVSGLARIGDALSEAQARSGNWGAMLGHLKQGSESVRAGLAMMKGSGVVGADLLVAFAERQLAFAGLLSSEIERVQAGDSTLV